MSIIINITKEEIVEILSKAFDNRTKGLNMKRVLNEMSPEMMSQILEPSLCKLFNEDIDLHIVSDLEKKVLDAVD